MDTTQPQLEEDDVRHLMYVDRGRLIEIFGKTAWQQLVREGALSHPDPWGVFRLDPDAQTWEAYLAEGADHAKDTAAQIAGEDWRTNGSAVAVLHLAPSRVMGREQH